MAVFLLKWMKMIYFFVKLIKQSSSLRRMMVAFYAKYPGFSAKIKSILLPYSNSGLPIGHASYQEVLEFRRYLQQSLPLNCAQNQLFVDISELVHRDAKSGIQRVVRNILREWLMHPSENIRIEPAYAVTEKLGYRYVRSLNNLLGENPIEYRSGDIFLGLDFQSQITAKQQAFYQEIRRQGVQVWFVVYDLLPILMPKCFLKGAAADHAAWFNVVKESDGIICISKAVADEVTDWLAKNPLQRVKPLEIYWFHQGADLVGDFNKSGVINGLLPNEQNVLNIIKQNLTFLMVGTIEPRKGHSQTLAAFEQLWREGYPINLVIVGKKGWMVDKLIKKIRTHVELSKRLFWLNGISDHYLDAVYKASTCLIAASFGEGFGLPLIEAAQHKIPIIARDIPVFQEVTAGHAFYFRGKDPAILAQSIKEWLQLFEQNRHQKSDSIPWQTWQQSAKQLLDILLSKKDVNLQEVVS